MLERKIEKYIDRMRDKYNITGAMITGSYVTGNMGPHSDIDIFFIWNDEERAMRGREYYLDLEFEYFISPEWKYFDRLKNDYIAMRIYSTAKILYDKEKKLEKIKRKAIDVVSNFSWNLTDIQKKDMKFHVETIQFDGLDIYDNKDYNNFLLFTSSNLEQMCKMICKLNNSLPIYMKYGVNEIKKIDLEFGVILNEFIVTDFINPKKRALWNELCIYLHKKIGEYNIKEYQNIQTLK